jgi:hypothetical protein
MLASSGKTEAVFQGETTNHNFKSAFLSLFSTLAVTLACPVDLRGPIDNWEVE